MHAEHGLDLDLTEMLAPAGMARAGLLALAPRLAALARRLAAWREGAPFAFFTLPFATDAAAIAARAAALRARFRRSVVFGIGGSSLGGEMLARILGDGSHPVRFFDNVDPDTLAALDGYDWRDTLLLVVSKSGNTAETLGQLLGVLPALERQCAGTLHEHVLVITENRDGALFRIATSLGLEVIEHPPVGGRYSVLSVVGLLPAALAGGDTAAVLAGARRMAERCLAADMEHNPAFLHGAAQYLHALAGRRMSVLMVYADRLRTLVYWFRQLWGESLGKRDAAGRSQGLTPVSAFGVTDQHSQLQLYLDGPDDKQFTLIVDPTLRERGTRLDARFAALPEVAPLAGHRVGELFHAEFEATCATLARHGRPLRRIALRAGDAAALGELIVLLEVETVVVAELLGIDPFDQPAVEEGKRLAREFLAR